MFTHRQRGRNAHAARLGLLASALMSVSAAAAPEPFVLVAYSTGGAQIAHCDSASAAQVPHAAAGFVARNLGAMQSHDNRPLASAARLVKTVG